MILYMHSPIASTNGELFNGLLNKKYYFDVLYVILSLLKLESYLYE